MRSRWRRSKAQSRQQALLQKRMTIFLFFFLDQLATRHEWLMFFRDDFFRGWRFVASRQCMWDWVRCKLLFLSNHYSSSSFHSYYIFSNIWKKNVGSSRTQWAGSNYILLQFIVGSIFRWKLLIIKYTADFIRETEGFWMKVKNPLRLHPSLRRMYSFTHLRGWHLRWKTQSW